MELTNTSNIFFVPKGKILTLGEVSEPTTILPGIIPPLGRATAFQQQSYANSNHIRTTNIFRSLSSMS